MKKYTVKPGDSLSLIAMRQLGDPAKWRQIAHLNAILDPGKIAVGQVLVLPGEEVPEPSTRRQDVIISVEGSRVYYRYEGDATKRLLGFRPRRKDRSFRPGLSRRGDEKPEAFIQQNRALLSRLKLSTSEINAMIATAENEGNLDAINTYDNSFLSFGMFQWTLGPRDNPGELPALVKLVQKRQPEAFEKYCGQFGVKVSRDTGGRDGYLVYKGKKVDTPEEKKFFRQHHVAYRFAVAGFDKRVNAAQILHAVNRFDRFHFTKQQQLGGFAISDLLSSEYAAALLLDHHVNRPGHVSKVVAAAVSATRRTARQLAEGTDRDEMMLIEKYLAVRETYGGRGKMTDARGRALVTKRHLDAGRVSARRRSFKSNRAARKQS